MDDVSRICVDRCRWVHQRGTVRGRAAGEHGAATDHDQLAGRLAAGLVDPDIPLTFGGTVGLFHPGRAGFLWDPDEDVSESLRHGHRRIGDLGAVLWSHDGVKRLITGRLRTVARHLPRRWHTGATLRAAPVLGGSTRQSRARNAVHRGMAAPAVRRAPVSLIYSAGDPGLDEFRPDIARSGRGLDAVAGASVVIVRDGDHNVTPLGARARLTETLIGALEP